MDKNAIIGMLLMGAVIFGFMWLNQPSEAELAQRRAATERAAEDAAMRDAAGTALGVTDTVTAAEIATLKTTVQQFGKSRSTAVRPEALPRLLRPRRTTWHSTTGLWQS